MARRDLPSSVNLAGIVAKRHGRTIAVGAAIEPLVAPTLRRRGFIESRVMRDWPAIVGDALATETMPIRLAFPRGERIDATLHIRVTGPLAVELQHLAPAVIERINGYFGYRAVARLSLKQAPRGHVPQRRARPRVELSAEDEERLAKRVSGVDDPGLRESLLALGRAMRVSGKAGKRRL